MRLPVLPKSGGSPDPEPSGAGLRASSWRWASFPPWRRSPFGFAMVFFVSLSRMSLNPCTAPGCCCRAWCHTGISRPASIPILGSACADRRLVARQTRYRPPGGTRPDDRLYGRHHVLDLETGRRLFDGATGILRRSGPRLSFPLLLGRGGPDSGHRPGHRLLALGLGHAPAGVDRDGAWAGLAAGILLGLGFVLSSPPCRWRRAGICCLLGRPGPSGPSRRSAAARVALIPA